MMRHRVLGLWSCASRHNQLVTLDLGDLKTKSLELSKFK